MTNEIFFLAGNNPGNEEHYIQKEYRTDILIKLNGLFYELYFFTPSSLEYELTGEGFFSFPGLVILEDMSTIRIKKSIANLLKSGYFDNLVGKKEMHQDKRFIHNWYINDLALFDPKDLSVEELNL